MTGKQKRKLRKRIKLAAITTTQDQWIEEVFGVAVETKRDRARLFGKAKPIMEAKYGAR